MRAVFLCPSVCHLSRCGPSCCGIHGRIADGVRALRTVGVTVGFPRTATDGLRYGVFQLDERR